MPEMLIYEIGSPGRTAASLPALDVPEAPLPEAMLRSTLDLPEVTEVEVTRHFTRLSQMNHAVDTGFYPLGSCTMKYNPKVNDRAAALPGFNNLHPYQHELTAQGALILMYEMQQYLGEISGLPAVSLQPAAGAHGEFTGMLVIRAYHLARGDHSAISGGYHNRTDNYSSSVSGGAENHARAEGSSISGGSFNLTSGFRASVSGGLTNTAQGANSNVSGGELNVASGDRASVSGGLNNTAQGLYSSVTGGDTNLASGETSSVAGGAYNTAVGIDSAVTGGYSNDALGVRSTVSGGLGRTANSGYDWVAGLLFQEN